MVVLIVVPKLLLHPILSSSFLCMLWMNVACNASGQHFAESGPISMSWELILLPLLLLVVIVQAVVAFFVLPKNYSTLAILKYEHYKGPHWIKFGVLRLDCSSKYVEHNMSTWSVVFTHCQCFQGQHVWENWTQYQHAHAWLNRTQYQHTPVETWESKYNARPARQQKIRYSN